MIILKRDIKFVSKKENKIKLLDKEDLLDGESRIEMYSNKQIVVDGCMGVLEFSDDFIKLKLKKGNAIIYGNGLNINGFEEKIITVSGSLQSIEFCIREKPKNA